MGRTVICIWIALTFGCLPLAAFPVRVTCSPPGAEVWASPVDQPVIYKKGITPCRIQLEDSGAPHLILVRKRGFFDVYRYAEPGTGAIEVQLPSRDDPRSWARLPGIEQLARGYNHQSSAFGLVSDHQRPTRPLAGVAPWADRFCDWAPDASAFVASGAIWGTWAEENRLIEEGDQSIVSDIWWVPLGGEPLLIHRWRSDPGMMYYFIMGGDFAPDPRWLGHSAAVGEREQIRLWCSATGESRTVAALEDANLHSPRFSPTGRLIACICELPDSDRPREEPAVRVEVMHFDGAGRRVLATGADDSRDPVFSPDERRVAFVTADGAVAVIPVSGGAARVIIEEPNWRPAEDPMWSPDGTRIAVACSAPGGEAEMGPGGDRLDRHVRRTFWASISGTDSGFIPGAHVIQWFDGASLLTVLRGYAVGPGVQYDRLAIVDLHGEVCRVLREPDVSRLGRPTVADKETPQSVQTERARPLPDELIPLSCLIPDLAPTIPSGGAVQ